MSNKVITELNKENTVVTQNISASEIAVIMDIYTRAVAKVNEGPVRLGWNTAVYPNEEFITTALEEGELCVIKEAGNIIGAAVVNYTVNDEYDLIDWQVPGPKDKISTIHALVIAPEYWGGGYSSLFLQGILDICREKGDIANHLDVIDTNSFAEKLYLNNGFTKIKDISMYYEVVGTRSFAMLEYVF